MWDWSVCSEFLHPKQQTAVAAEWRQTANMKWTFQTKIKINFNAWYEDHTQCDHDRILNFCFLFFLCKYLNVEFYKLMEGVLRKMCCYNTGGMTQYMQIKGTLLRKRL